MYFLLVVGGIIFGFLVAFLFLRKDPIGTILLDNTDTDSSPYLFLEIDRGKANQLYSNKIVTLRVNITQK